LLLLKADNIDTLLIVLVTAFVVTFISRILIFIWIIYAIIFTIYSIYEPLNDKSKKIYIKILILIFLIIIFSIVSIIIFKKYNKDLSVVLNEVPSCPFYETTSYYFINNDKIYYYAQDSNLARSKIYDRLYVMNLDGSQNKKIVETDELRCATFYFVYENEAYFYTPYYSENKKINLETGKITSLGNSDSYLPITLKNGIVNVFENSFFSDNVYSMLKKVNLENNEVIYETRTKYNLNGAEFYFDYSGGNIYHFSETKKQLPAIYLNNDILYEFEDKNVKEIDIIANSNDYLYYRYENYIYKLNIKEKTIEAKIKNKIGNFYRISSGNNFNNYFYSNNSIYEFDLITDTFNLVVSGIEREPDNVYVKNNKLIFTENTDNLYEKKLGSVVVYDIYTKKLEQFNFINKLSFDENNMYLLIIDNQEYRVHKYTLVNG